MELASFSEIDMDEDEKAREDAIRQCCQAVFGNVDATGVNWLVSEIASKCTHDKESVRKEACWCYQVLVTESKSFMLDIFSISLNEENNHIILMIPIGVNEGFYK